MEFKTLRLSDAQIKFAGDKPTFTGYASKFGGVDSYGDTILPGAFTKAVAATRGEVKMYFNHGWLRRELPIGKMFVEQDDVGLMVKGVEFTHGLEAAESVIAAVRHGTVDGLSIGFGLAQGGFTKRANGRDIHEIEYLKEVSIVDFPADSAARIQDVKASLDQCETLQEIETLLREAGGFSRSEATSLVGRIKTMTQREAEAKRKLQQDLEGIFERFCS